MSPQRRVDDAGAVPANLMEIRMKKSLVAMSALLALSVGLGSAVAQNKTREQVQAEAKEAARSPAGKGEADCGPMDNKSTKTRDQVKAETQAAKAAGQTVGDECVNPTVGKSTRPSSEVKAEAKKAAKSPEGKGEADVKN
jgi:hypothetical protein